MGQRNAMLIVTCRALIARAKRMLKTVTLNLQGVRVDDFESLDYLDAGVNVADLAEDCESRTRNAMRQRCRTARPRGKSQSPALAFTAERVAHVRLCDAVLLVACLF